MTHGNNRRARNLGLRSAHEMGFTTAFIAEDDTSPSLLAFERTVAALDEHPEAVLVGSSGGTFRFGLPRWGRFGLAVTGSSSEARMADFVHLDNCAVRIHDFLEVGGLREDFFIMFEEPEVGWRIRRAGRSVFVAPTAVSRLTLGASSSSREHPWRAYYQARNFLRFGIDARSPVLVGGFVLRSGRQLALDLSHGRWKIIHYRSVGALDALRGRLGSRMGAEPRRRLSVAGAYEALGSVDRRDGRKALAHSWAAVASAEISEGSVGLAHRAVRESFAAHPVPQAAWEAVRIAVGYARSLHPPASMPGNPSTALPLRAQGMEPLRRGGPESRQIFTGALHVAVVASLAVPRPLRGWLRRAATMASRCSEIPARTCWGTILFAPGEVRLIAPYADEPFEIALLAERTKIGMTVVDVGANLGWYSLMFAAKVGESGRVVAVEPDPRMAARLRRLLEVNSKRDFSIEQCALWRESGEQSLVTGAESALNHLASPNESFPDRSVSVQALSFADLCDRHHLTNVDVLKVDVDGAEPDVLAGVLEAPAGLWPETIMFEYEPQHWRRMGHADFWTGLGVLPDYYDIEVIDYAVGDLVRVERGVEPVQHGRNLLARRRADPASA